MSTIVTIARKELRGYFLSPVAIIFVGVFLLVTLFAFFTYSRFFARNIADVRPLFEWLPLLLIFLVAAVTMRAWSEEEKIGTLELLLTLPVRTGDVVLGKFVAGMVLVAIALALTLPLPITVFVLGDLDWGPVIGGYVAAFLLAGTYMAVGLCVSSRTDNQIVSLMLTAVVCAVLYLIGADAIAGFFGDRAGEFLRALGTGSRFASIERGVLDLRDLAYYGALTAFCLILNVHFVDLKRLETGTPTGRSRALGHWTTIALVALNVAALNVWLAPITRARADLTAAGEYSLSGATSDLLSRLDEPVRLSGYFSERTHPLLAPLVPRIRDLLHEYEVHGRGRVSVDFGNPNADEHLEQELAETYDIRPVPFRVFGRHEESVVNSYFHVLVRYGDQYEVLDYEDLIEVDADMQHIDVRLRNLEYDLTRTIKNLAEGFQNIDAIFARLDTPAKLTAYITPGTLPDEFKEVPERLREVANELSGRSGGKFTFEEVDPSDNAELQNELQKQYGFRPMAVSLFGGERYYLYLLYQAGERLEAIYPQGDLTAAALKSTIEASIRRSVPGFLRTVALLSEKPQPPAPHPNLPPQFQPQPQPEYLHLERELEADFTFRRLELEDGFVPGDVDVLVVAKSGHLGEEQKFAIDQYLMRGGSVVALTGAYEVSARGERIEVRATDPGLTDLLSAYGVNVHKGFVLDPQNARFPVPITEQRGIFTFQRILYMDYPFFVDIRSDGFGADQAAISGLNNVVLNWGSEVDLAGEREGVEAQRLLMTSPGAWTLETEQVLPATVAEAERAFPPTGEVARRPVAVTVVGRIPSYFANRPSPLFGEEGEQPPASAGEVASNDRTGRTLKESSAESRLVVIGSSAFASDFVQQLGEQIGATGGLYRGNFQLVRNLIDWATEDTELLRIRGVGAFARTLMPMTDGQKTRWEFVNYAFVLIALGAIVLGSVVRRRRTVPIQLAEDQA